MRVFIAEDMQSIRPNEVSAIVAWCERHDLTDTGMVLSKIMYETIETGDSDGGDGTLSIDAPSILATYKASSFRSFEDPEIPPEMIYDGGAHPSSLIKTAEFNYDDFPWPEGY